MLLADKWAQAEEKSPSFLAFFFLNLSFGLFFISAFCLRFLSLPILAFQKEQSDHGVQLLFLTVHRGQGSAVRYSSVVMDFPWSLETDPRELLPQAIEIGGNNTCQRMDSLNLNFCT